MLIDNKGRLFGKVSIIDLVIILIVVAAVAGIGYKYAKSQIISPLSKTQNFIMTFQEDERPEFAVNAIKAGDIVKDKLSGVVIGKVTKVEIGPSKSYGNDSQGKWVQSPKPGYVSYFITVKGSGLLAPSGVTIGGTEFCINKQDTTKFGNSLLYPRITSIQETKE